MRRSAPYFGQFFPQARPLRPLRPFFPQAIRLHTLRVSHPSRPLHPLQAALGFEWQPEDQRLKAISRHVQQLLEISDVVGLQEVPVTYVTHDVTWSGCKRCL